MAVVERGLEALDRADVDDRAAARPHRRGGLSRHRRDARDVDAEHLDDLLVADRLERRDRLDPGVVHDDVEAAERLDRDRADRARVALNVADRGDGAIAELGDERLDRREIPVRVSDDRRARLVEPPRDPGADVPARPGDDRDATGQIEQRADRRRRIGHAG